jgi:Putative Ig domain
MQYGSPDQTPRTRANRANCVHVAAFFACIPLLLWLTACSGFSVPASANNSTPAPGSTQASGSASVLSISTTLPQGSVDSNYNAAVSVTGGTAPYKFSMTSGQLPTGVSLGTSGTIAGMPTATGVSNFALTVSDSKGLSKQQSLEITVAQNAGVTISVTPTTISVPTGGAAQFNAQVSNTSDTAVTWTATAGSISSSGLFSAPHVTANTTVTIAATSVADPSESASATVTVTPSSKPENSFSELQQSGGWGQAGQGPPDFIDCSPSPCDGITFSMEQEIKSPSMSGSSTQFNLGGTADYTDALFNNHLIGAYSSQGLPDKNHTLVPTYHNFTYDVYFYGSNLELSQALEFDINQFFDNLGFIWGHECRVGAGNEWDIWDNVTAHWVHTGVSCYPKNNAWNHLTIQVQRTSSNQLLYQSITLNGVTNTLNQYYDAGSAVNWYGITINYQMDGNNKQTPYTVYLDNLTFSYE